MLNDLIIRENMFNKINLIGWHYEDTTSKSMQIELKVYNLYMKGSKQNIKAKKEDDPFRMEVIGRLINTIYFKHKKMSPILIFTESKRLRWWVSQLRRICPYHTILKLVGSDKYIATVLSTYFYSHLQKKFHFDILILSYENLMAIMRNLHLNLNLLIDDVALMIVDEKINGIGQYLYKTATIPKIKLSSKDTEEWNSQS